MPTIRELLPANQASGLDLTTKIGVALKLLLSLAFAALAVALLMGAGSAPGQDATVIAGASALVAGMLAVGSVARAFRCLF